MGDAEALKHLRFVLEMFTTQIFINWKARISRALCEQRLEIFHAIAMCNESRQVIVLTDCLRKATAPSDQCASHHTDSRAGGCAVCFHFSFSYRLFVPKREATRARTDMSNPAQLWGERLTWRYLFGVATPPNFVQEAHRARTCRFAQASHAGHHRSFATRLPIRDR